MTDSFDPNEFLGATFEEPTDTKRTPCPVGEYNAVAGAPKVRGWETDKNGGSAGVSFDVPWEIYDQAARDATGRDKVVVVQSFTFSFYQGTQEIDKEKAKSDIRFGKFREAIGLNNDSFSWMQVEGRMAKVKVVHEPYKDTIQDKVGAVTAV